MKIFAHNLKKEKKNIASEFMQRSEVRSQIPLILNQINKEGIDPEFTSFMVLMSVFDSLGYNLAFFKIPREDWNLFNENLSQRIANENFDLRSLIKVLGSLGC